MNGYIIFFSQRIIRRMRRERKRENKAVLTQNGETLDMEGIDQKVSVTG